MTNEELCLRYQAGDANAAEELIARNMGVIRKLALGYDRAYRSVRMDADDYTQEGAVALLRAANQYDPSHKVSFLSYAGQVIRNAIVDAIRADNPSAVLIPLEDSRTATVNVNNEEADRSITRIKTHLPSTYETNPEYIFIRKEQLEELYSAIRTLPPRHHTWILCRYGFDDDTYKSLAEMGRIYHLSESRAKKAEDEAISKLRRKMNV